MKKFFLFLIVVALVPALAFGQATKAKNQSKGLNIPKHWEKVTATQKYQDVKTSLPAQKSYQLPAEKKGGITYESLVMTNRRMPAYATDAQFLGKNVSKLAYDPYTNALYFAMSIYTNEILNDQTSPLKAQIWIYKSFDRGTTWDLNPTRIIPDANLYYLCPTIEIANPYKTKNPDSLFVIVNSYSFDLTSYLYTGCSSFRLFNGTTHSYTVFESLISEATWRLAKPLPTYKFNGDVLSMNIFAYGEPAAFSQDIRTDLYAALLDKTVENGTLIDEDPENLLPESWALSNFIPDPSEVSVGSTAWSPMNGAVDNEGTPYVMIYNLNAEGTPRLPAVSKSNDLGSTWTDLEWFPYESLIASLKTYDNEIFYCSDSHYWWAYDGADMVALGKDQLSFFRRNVLAYEYKNEQNVKDTAYYYALLEFKKDGNIWSVNPVTGVKRTALEDGTELGFNGADLAYVPVGATSYNGSQSYLIRSTNDEELPVDDLEITNRGQELQISKTLNGDLVAKWIDFTGYEDTDLYRFPSVPLLNNEDDVVIDSLLKTDVYMAYRKAGDNKWSTPMRVFGDKQSFTNFSPFYPKKGTYIPKIVPSLNEIPMIDLVVDTVYDVDRQAYPAALQELGADGETGHLVVCHKIALDSLLGPISVEEPTVDQKSTIGEIYPNPASDRIEFSFTLTRPAFVNIEIFNSVGEKVALVHNGTVNFLANAVSFNGVKDFPSGAYYCVVTIDGQKTTRKFTVAR